MTKTRSVFKCQQCGYEAIRWLGKCPDCGEWNSFVEETQQESHERFLTRSSVSEPKTIDTVTIESFMRISTSIDEFDRILGGGVVPGSLVLLGGPPGIGKSTLLLQVADKLAIKRDVLYVSGEESIEQIKIRAMRLQVNAGRLFIVSETNLENIVSQINKIQPACVIIDSIQTVYKQDMSGAPGSVGQVRECTAELVRIAKNLTIAVFISGQVTKEGTIAGPKVLEHMVDTVLYFEGDSHFTHRILRAYKNRFGSTNEVGIFSMQENGLTEVKDPSRIFLQERPLSVSGSVVVASIEGTRPLLVELQALVNTTNFAVPQRRVTGVDYNRTCLLLAVLEKRSRYHLGAKDVFINIAGGINVKEPAVDLGILVAVASAVKNIPCDIETVVMGEVGLAGEIRAVDFIQKRVKEAAKLGFKQCIIPQANLSGLHVEESIKIIAADNINKALEHVFV